MIDLKSVNLKINSLIAQISKGERKLNSTEFNQSLSLNDSISKKEQIIKHINIFKNKIEMIETDVSFLKDGFERLKILKLKNDPQTKIEEYSILNEINKTINKDTFREYSGLVDDGEYKYIDLNLNHSKLKYSSLEELDDSFDYLNNIHSMIGSFNKSLDLKEESISSKKNIQSIEYIDLKAIDYPESISNLNFLKIQYEAIALTLKKTEELSLVKFIK